MAFTKSTPPASASKSIFNVFSPSSSGPSVSPASESSKPGTVSPASSWFSDEVKRSESDAGTASAAEASENSESSESSSFLGYFIRFIFIVLLLGFAGFNAFKEMGLITDDVVNFVRPLTDSVTGLLGSVSKHFISTTSEGTRTGIDILSGAAKSGVNLVDDQVTGKAGHISSEGPNVVPSSGGGTAKQEAARARALTMKTGAQLDEAVPAPDEATSVTQKGKTSGKAGYCLVGEDRGNRSCAYVNEIDTCMSGNIFPSKDKCINPSLRV